MIYLDHNATTPVDPAVVAAMAPLFTDQFANPSSTHAAGQDAARRVAAARRQVAALVGTTARHVVFTSGATEAAHLAVRGAMSAVSRSRRRILVGATEHWAVLAAAETVASAIGGQVQQVPVRPDGTIDPVRLESLLGPDVALVAVMAANNETGVVNDVARLGALAHRSGALFCSDLTQAAGRIPVTIEDWRVDLGIWSAHKLHGPKGIGALAASPALQARMTPVLTGGGQERGLRAGTLNTPGIVGFGVASELAARILPEEARRQRALTALLHRLLADRVPVHVVGEGAERVPNTVNLRFPGAAADAVQSVAPQVMISSGAACSTGSEEPSHVLLAMGLTGIEALECLRFSVGRSTTEQQVRAAADLVAAAVARVRALSGPADRGHPRLVPERVPA